MVWKKGLAWHGCWLTWFDMSLNSLLGYRVNQISEDGKEDSEAAAQCLSLAVNEHHKIFPQHTKFILDADGAGAFAGIGYFGRIGYLKSTIGVECIEHSIGESGGGKSPLDAGFGTDKYEVRAEVL